MDPITHGLIGGVAARSLNVDRRRFWVMVGLGLAPDLDFIANLFGGWAHLFQHRGLTHSVVGIALQAIFYSWLLKRWDKGSFKTRAFHYSLPLMFHVLGDLLTNHGVPLLSPFSLQAFSWDVLGSINLLPTALTIAGLLWLNRSERSGWKATTPVWGVWVLYLCLVLTGKSYASKLVPSQSSMGVVPSLMNPFSWTGVSFDGDRRTYTHYSIDLLYGTCTNLGSFESPGTSYPVQMSMKGKKVKNFLTETRWPMVRVEETKDGWNVEWGHILYSTLGMVRSDINVRLSKDGRVLNEENVVKFWNPSLS